MTPSSSPTPPPASKANASATPAIKPVRITAPPVRVPAEHAQLLRAHLTAAGQILGLGDRKRVCIEFTVDTRISGPSILLNTLPKSGSVYLLSTLMHGLGLDRDRISGGYFPDDLIIRDLVESFTESPGVAQEHLPARRLNLVQLNNRVDRMLVHVRDPRQATLSWTHHINKLNSKNDLYALSVVMPTLPEDYFDRDLSQQIEWQIEHHLPLLVKWIEGWLKADQDATFKPKIKFTRYKDFHRNELEFIASILDFYGIAHQDFQHHGQSPKQGDAHYRQGRTDEWRQVFSADQIIKANAVVPDALLERFGWER